MQTLTLDWNPKPIRCITAKPSEESPRIQTRSSRRWRKSSYYVKSQRKASVPRVLGPENARTKEERQRSGLSPPILSWLQLIGKGSQTRQSRHGLTAACHRVRPRRSSRLQAIFRKDPTRALMGSRRSSPIQHQRKGGNVIIPWPSALLRRTQLQAVARLSESIGLSSRATDDRSQVSRSVASLWTTQARFELHLPETAL